MSLFNKFKKTTIAINKTQERIYAEVMDELEQGKMKKGLWGKALSDGLGDETKARGIYIKLRFKDIKDNTGMDQKNIET
ncbi:MAG: hypothetical protein DRQ51_02465 [Gammaproteobacteria bacterium]|nr:MAG: hypothetical protein DRQ51_02465 [Gammaproteobacteria bacterium]